jgi:glycosyltransferase involved in cell wall biosynthesis
LSTRRCVTIVNLTANKIGQFWRIARLLPDVDFLAVAGGYGPQSIPRRLPANVELLQHVPSDRMNELVWSRTVLLLAPSRQESWGMTANEALQRGIPVIAHPTGGLVESLGMAGLFVDRDRSSEWAHTITRLLADGPAYRRWSARARARAAQLAQQSAEHIDRFVAEIERVAHV